MLEHVRLGSRAIILSRTFHGDPSSAEELSNQMDLRDEISQLRRVPDIGSSRSQDETQLDKARIRETIQKVARSLRQ